MCRLSSAGISPSRPPDGGATRVLHDDGVPCRDAGVRALLHPALRWRLMAAGLHKAVRDLPVRSAGNCEDGTAPQLGERSTRHRRAPAAAPMELPSEHGGGAEGESRQQREQQAEAPSPQADDGASPSSPSEQGPSATKRALCGFLPPLRVCAHHPPSAQPGPATPCAQCSWAASAGRRQKVISPAAQRLGAPLASLCAGRLRPTSSPSSPTRLYAARPSGTPPLTLVACARAQRGYAPTSRSSGRWRTR